MASLRSLRGLDWLNFSVAHAQTGFGAFIAVYLTTEAWTQAEIGEALSLGTAAAMLAQIPGGAVVDWLRDKRVAVVIATLTITVSAILFAAVPTKFAVMLAEVLHSFASCMLSPALAAISLALVGRAAFGERLGRNARFASFGNGIAAVVMGALGAYVSSRAVFWLAAASMVPGLLALRVIRRAEMLPRGTIDSAPSPVLRSVFRDTRALLANRRVLAFAGCVVLFHLSNAALLPLVGGQLTRIAGATAHLLIAACIVVPQAIVALTSPWIGRTADRAGPRLVLAFGFAALPVRGLLLAATDDPMMLVAIQALDGVSAAAFGVMLPLVAADLTLGTERFNLCMGVLGLAAAGGATLSTLVAGLIADHFGTMAAFLALAGCGLMAVFAVLATTKREAAKCLPRRVVRIFRRRSLGTTPTAGSPRR
jgi:MFS family permease